MRILVDVAHGTVDESLVESLAAFAMETLGLPDDAELSVSFVTDGEMAKLNGSYRGKSGPTDVLSFECDSLDDGFPVSDDGCGFTLGDIVIAPDVAGRQATEFGETLDEELSVLLVHGILHLMGYDHIEEEEALAMEQRQRSLLDAWRKEAQGGEG